MSEENISQRFRLKNREEIKKYLIKEIDHIKLMSKCKSSISLSCNRNSINQYVL